MGESNQSGSYYEAEEAERRLGPDGSAHPALLGVGAVLSDRPREFRERQLSALSKARHAALLEAGRLPDGNVVEAIVREYLRAMRESEGER